MPRLDSRQDYSLGTLDPPVELPVGTPLSSAGSAHVVDAPISYDHHAMGIYTIGKGKGGPIH